MKLKTKAAALLPAALLFAAVTVFAASQEKDIVDHPVQNKVIL